jgi:hypothetical protein
MSAPAILGAPRGVVWRVSVMQQEDVAVRIFEHRVVADPGVERMDESHTARLQLGARRRYVLDVKGDRRVGLELAAERCGIEHLQGEVARLELGSGTRA